MTRPRHERRDALVALAWTLTIYLAIPYARTIQQWVYERAGRQAFSVLVYGIVLAAVAMLVAMVRRDAVRLPRAGWPWLLGVAAAYAVGTHALRHSPEEALHLVEYGVLSWLLFRALRHRLHDPAIYVVAALLCALLGTVDELIQWAVPRRFWDFRDLAINTSAGVLMQVALARGVRPNGVAGPARATSVRLACRLASIWLLILLACASNTPAGLAAMQARLPFLRGLNETMIEFGHLHRDPVAGAFYSRLTREELAAEDQERAVEVGELLRQSGSDREYDAFLARHAPQVDPFVHEMRVHLFRRDRFWRDARAARERPDEHAALIAVAWHEQALLERHFGRSLRASGLDWPEDLRARARDAARPGAYTSAVSAHLVTRLTLSQVQVLLAAALLVTFALERYYARRERLSA